MSESMERGTRRNERQRAPEKPTLYVDNNGDFAYVKDGTLVVLNDEGKAERARQEREQGTPPQGDFPLFGGVAHIDSFDKIQNENLTSAPAADAAPQNPNAAPQSALEAAGLDPTEWREAGDQEIFAAGRSYKMNPNGGKFVLMNDFEKAQGAALRRLEQNVGGMKPEEAAELRNVIQGLQEGTPRAAEALARIGQALDLAERNAPAPATPPVAGERPRGVAPYANLGEQPPAAAVNPWASMSAGPTVAPTSNAGGGGINVTPNVQPLSQQPQGLGTPAGVVPNFIRRRASRIELAPRAVLRKEAPTMDVILADRKKQENFGYLVANPKFGRADLIEKHTRSMEDPSAMSVEDNIALKEAREEFERRTLLAQEVAAGITKEEMMMMLQDEPNLLFLSNNLKPERAAELIKQNLDAVFMKASDADINEMVFAHRANLDIRASKQYKGLAERTAKYLGTTPEGVQFVNDPIMRQQILRAGFFTLGQSPAKLLRTDNAISENVSTLGRLLGATISPDADLRRLVSREAIVATPVPAMETLSVGSYQESVRESDKVMTMKTIRDSVPEFKSTYQERYGKDWAATPVAERQNDFFNEVQRREASRPQLRQSWFGALVGVLLTMLVGKARNDRELNSALAAA